MAVTSSDFRDQRGWQLRRIAHEQCFSWIPQKWNRNLRLERLRGFVHDEGVGLLERRHDRLACARERAEHQARAIQSFAREFIRTLTAPRALFDFSRDLLTSSAHGRFVVHRGDGGETFGDDALAKRRRYGFKSSPRGFRARANAVAPRNERSSKSRRDDVAPFENEIIHRPAFDRRRLSQRVLGAREHARRGVFATRSQVKFHHDAHSLVARRAHEYALFLRREHREERYDEVRLPTSRRSLNHL